MNGHMDFLKANFGLLVLLVIALVLHMSAFHAVHSAGEGDWLGWLQGKEGEILAAVLTVIVGNKGNQRTGDKQPEPPKLA